jgi:putative inorganic carbon (hco3(-)) transporter
MNPSKKQGNRNNKGARPSADFGYSAIVLAYSLVTVLTPNLQTFDSNGPKFLMLAVLNLISYLYLLSRKDFRTQPFSFSRFILNPSGMALLAFLILSLLSFLSAININESVLQVAKLFTFISSTYILFLVFSKGEVYFRLMAFTFTVILVIDCLTVFYNIDLFVEGRMKSLIDLKSIYSNKNILTAAIFVKIPFALFFGTFYTGKWKFYGNAATFLGFLAIFFMSARAFYIGSLLLAVGYLGFLLVRYYQSKSKLNLKQALSFTLIFAGSFAFYLTIQSFVYPKSDDLYAENVAKRMGSIVSDSASVGRSMAWGNSLILIHENPLTGVGTGNWKVRELQYENPKKTDYKYLVKTHNDFLEAASETGIPGGLAYLAVFIFPFVYFILLLKRRSPDEEMRSMFLVAAGVFCYSIDAFFNFPADRPEVQVLFASYIAAFIAAAPPLSQGLKIPARTVPIFRAVFLVMVIGSVFVLQLNFRSLRYQRITEEEILAGTLTTSADAIVSGLPSIPDLNSSGEPVDVIKARYLINEKRLDDALLILKQYDRSPYDSRKEYFMAMAYGMKGENDSALIYLRKAHELKPLNQKTNAVLCKFLAEKGDYAQAQEVAVNYLKHVRNDRQMWFIAIELYEKSGNLKGALAVNDSAIRYLPGDTLLHEYRSVLASRLTGPPVVSPGK